MKNIKAYNKHKNFSLILLVICLILFNTFNTTSCGLEKFYFISKPLVPSDHKIPDYNQSELLSQSFRVKTQIQQEVVGSFSYSGTEIYYKIYNETSKLNSEKSALEKRMGDDSYGSANLLIENYKFQPLCVLSDNGDKSEILITSNNADVTFRLTDSNIDGYKSYFKVNGTRWGIPVRVNGKTFNFNDPNNKPLKVQNNKDVDIEKDNNSGEWFVAVYAVSRGHDQTYYPSYSTITYLGTVKIFDTKPN